jgi:hypothetical protein
VLKVGVGMDGNAADGGFGLFHPQYVQRCLGLVPAQYFLAFLAVVANFHFFGIRQSTQGVLQCF